MTTRTTLKVPPPRMPPPFTMFVTLFLAFLIWNMDVAAFVVAPSMRAFYPTPRTSNHDVCRQATTMTRSDRPDFSTNEGTSTYGGDPDEDEMDIDFLFQEPEIPYENLDSMEKVWRHAKKPLLRIGSKGATHSHGNSLRQLLEDHTVVKVKCNLKKFGRSSCRRSGRGAMFSAGGKLSLSMSTAASYGSLSPSHMSLLCS
jgi:hypothetical protein